MTIDLCSNVWLVLFLSKGSWVGIGQRSPKDWLELVLKNFKPVKLQLSADESVQGLRVHSNFRSFSNLHHFLYSARLSLDYSVFICCPRPVLWTGYVWLACVRSDHLCTCAQPLVDPGYTADLLCSLWLPHFLELSVKSPVSLLALPVCLLLNQHLDNTNQVSLFQQQQSCQQYSLPCPCFR